MELVKDHEIAQLINRLTATAKKYAGAQQLRENIAADVVDFLELKGLRKTSCKDQTKTPPQLKKQG